MPEENQDIGTLDQADNVLMGLTSRAPQNQINVNDVMAGTGNYRMSPAEMDVYDQYRQMQGSGATGALSESAYYPSNDNPAVGNFSTSGEGLSISGTTYAPGGGLVPLALLDARDLAVKQAGLRKQKEIEDFRKQFKAPTSKLVGINESLTEEYFKHQQDSWQKALKKAGGDPNKATFLLKNDPTFWAKEKSYHDLAKEGDAIANKIGDIEHRVAKGDVMSPALIETKNKVLRDMDPSSPGFKDLSYNIRKMDADREFSDATNEALLRAVTTETGQALNLSNEEDYKIFKTSIEELSPETKQSVIDNLKNIYQGSQMYSPEYIEKNAGGLMNYKKVKQDLSIHAKPKPDENDNYTEEDISKEPSSTNVYTRNQSGPLGQVNVEQNVSVGDYGVTHKKPIPVIIPNGSHVYINDAANGLIKSTEVNPNAKTQLFKTELIKVYDGSAKEHRGTPVSEKQIAEGRKWKWEPMTKGVVTETDADGNKIEKQIFVPAREVENVLVKKRDKEGNVVKGIPVDKLEKEAEKRNAELKTVLDKKPDTDKDVKTVEDLRKKYNY